MTPKLRVGALRGVTRWLTRQEERRFLLFIRFGFIYFISICYLFCWYEIQHDVSFKNRPVRDITSCLQDPNAWWEAAGSPLIWADWFRDDMMFYRNSSVVFNSWDLENKWLLSWSPLTFPGHLQRAEREVLWLLEKKLEVVVLLRLFVAVKHDDFKLKHISKSIYTKKS